MNRSLQLGFMVAVTLLWGASVRAQTRGGAFAGHMGSGAVIHRPAMAHGRPTPYARPGAQAIRRGTAFLTDAELRGFSDQTQTDNSVAYGAQNGVPGLGFDYPHLAAISGGIDNNRFGRGGRHGDHDQGAFVPFSYGGYPYYDTLDYGDTADEQSQIAPQENPQQPQVIVVQPIIQQAAAQPAPSQATAGVPPAATDAAPATNDVSGYVLVLGNGKVLFASAYSITGTQLRYVTPDGIRGALPVAELDSAATQAMNQARGIDFQL